MKVLSGAVAALVCVAGLAVAQEEGKARPARRAFSPEQQAKNLESQVARMEKQLEGLDKRYGNLTSPEAKAQLQKVKDLNQSAIAEMKEQIEQLKQGQPGRGRGRGSAAMRDIGAAQVLLGLYASKDEAQAKVASGDEQTKAAAATVVELCDKMIAKHHEIAKLQTEQAELQVQLRQAQREAKLGPQPQPRRKAGASAKRKARKKQAEAAAPAE